MSRLWDRGEPLDPAVLRLTVDRDPELDLQLVPWDCLASAAHATMLTSIGILSDDELAALRGELAAIHAEAEAGEFVIETKDKFYPFLQELTYTRPLTFAAASAFKEGLNSDPTLLVMITIVFVKFTVRPWPSVSRPSSSTCKSRLNTLW